MFLFFQIGLRKYYDKTNKTNMFILGIYRPHNQNGNDLQKLFYKFSEIFEKAQLKLSQIFIIGDLKINLHEIGDDGKQVGYQI